MADPVVLYIGGMHRSGSTLFSMLLGAVEGVCAPGELRLLWRRGVIENTFCGCGVPFLDCPFWRDVGAEGFGGWSEESARTHDRALRKATATGAALSASAGLPGRAAARAAVGEAAATHARLARAIATVAEATVVVDASKHPRYGVVLTRSDLGLRIAHLVRDSRAVAFSWAREKPIPRTAARTGRFPALRPWQAAGWWAASNVATELLLRRPGRHYRRLRYEELVQDPSGVVERVLGMAGLGSARLPLREGGVVAAGLQHTVHGNPVRFHDGTIAIRPDDAWEREMPARARRQVTALTWPLLLRYGYRP